MAVRTSFTAGEVLAAADLTDTFGSKVDYALPVDAESGTTYTFTLANAKQLVTATSASAKTFTIPPQSSVTWTANSILRVVNYGAGALTVAGGVGVTVTNAAKTLAQFESAALVRTGSDAWTLVPFSGGVGNADFSDAATGTYTDGGIDYKYKTYTSSGTLTITGTGGFADVLVVGGGGGGMGRGGGGGGAGGHLEILNAYLPAGTATVTIGAGGAFGDVQSGVRHPPRNGVASQLSNYYGVGGGIGGSDSAVLPAGGTGGSGGGGGGTGPAPGGAAGGAGTPGQGNAGGASLVNTGGGGGGANAAGVAAVGTVAGNGGAGKANSFTGSSVTRGGGGGGGSAGGTAGSGGAGGGGNGTNNDTTAQSGTANTGGGGGGGGQSSGDGADGGNGGSGVVIVRVRTN